MESNDLFAQLCNFRSKSLKHVETQITTASGKKYTEKRDEHGSYVLKSSGVSAGYVLDLKADISVAVVLSQLVLGSQDVAMELKVLHNFNITHILNVGYNIANFFETNFVYKNIEILDVPEFDIRLHFDECFQFIDEGRKDGCVLVHCNAGISRAPTVVIAYLMNRNHMRFPEALQLVKSVRPSVRPNDGFIKTLQAYDRELFSLS